MIPDRDLNPGVTGYKAEVSPTRLQHSVLLVLRTKHCRRGIVKSPFCTSERQVPGGRSVIAKGFFFSPSPFKFSPTNHHSTIAPYPSITVPRGSTLSHPRSASLGLLLCPGIWLVTEGGRRKPLATVNL
jgi:hypothetical protein